MHPVTLLAVLLATAITSNHAQEKEASMAKDRWTDCQADKENFFCLGMKYNTQTLDKAGSKCFLDKNCDLYIVMEREARPPYTTLYSMYVNRKKKAGAFVKENLFTFDVFFAKKKYDLDTVVNMPESEVFLEAKLEVGEIATTDCLVLSPTSRSRLSVCKDVNIITAFKDSVAAASGGGDYASFRWRSPDRIMVNKKDPSGNLADYDVNVRKDQLFAHLRGTFAADNEFTQRAVSAAAVFLPEKVTTDAPTITKTLAPPTPVATKKPCDPKVGGDCGPGISGLPTSGPAQIPGTNNNKPSPAPEPVSKGNLDKATIPFIAAVAIISILLNAL